MSHNTLPMSHNKLLMSHNQLQTSHSELLLPNQILNMHQTELRSAAEQPLASWLPSS